MSTITDLSRLGPDLDFDDVEPDLQLVSETKTGAALPAIGARWLGHSLRDVRRRQGLSRAHVAHSAGMTKRELAAYENGRVAVPETDLCSLAGSCGVEVDELIGQHGPALPDLPHERSYPENPFAVLRDVDNAHSSENDADFSDENDDVFWEPRNGNAMPLAPPDPAIAETAELVEIRWLADGMLRVRPSLGDLQRVNADWDTGGIFPRAVVDDEVPLQHADTQWALVDARAPDDIKIEAVVDFSAGAGFGVLFRASIDDAARISGYAFEIDPAPGSGGYLLRAWSDDRQHWCPLSRAIVTEPRRMFGHHTIEVNVVGDRVTAAVDGDQVLVIPSLIGTTSRLGLEPCAGSSVGVLSRATTEITVDTFRVAHS
jgi:transcriptional regulator with XRE-family HTH domain